MPNMLAHIGAQTILTRLSIPKADPRWVWLGCVLPDLPWIAQRGLRTVLSLPPLPVIDASPYALRLYAIVQSALPVTLILAAALACLSRRPWQTFGVLGLGAFAHLLLDATQTKWGNGVLLAAPLDWHVVNLGLYWPEDAPTWILTSLGGLCVALVWLRWRPAGAALRAPTPRRVAAAFVLSVVYVVAPLILVPAAWRADVHHAATLHAHIIGAPVAFDRARVVVGPGGPVLIPWTGQRFILAGPARVPPDAATASVRGRIAPDGTLAVEAFKAHPSGRRDFASYMGLALIAALWLRGPFGRWRIRRSS